MKRFFKCTDGSSNKFWVCDTDGSTFQAWYGRIGQTWWDTKPKVEKKLGSDGEAQRYMLTQISKKLSARDSQYKELTEDELRKQASAHELIGWRYKINNIKYEVGGITYDGYVPGSDIVITLLESWNKTETNYVIRDNKLFFQSGSSCSDNDLLSGLRQLLAFIMDTINDASLSAGTRDFDIDGIVGRLSGVASPQAIAKIFSYSRSFDSADEIASNNKTAVVVEKSARAFDF